MHESHHWSRRPCCVPSAAMAQAIRQTQVKRGEYLVTIGRCHDCHTPLVIGPNGPEPDMKRALSGHPQDIAVGAGTPPGPCGRGTADADSVVRPVGRELHRQSHTG